MLTLNGRVDVLVQQVLHCPMRRTDRRIVDESYRNDIDATGRRGLRTLRAPRRLASTF
jgi:hypothetical protein